MVFGESMFSHRSNASKIALAGLVAFCRQQGIVAIDCQQNTGHLASLGAREVGRAAFVQHLHQATLLPAPAWHFSSVYWNHLLHAHEPT
jgi:leucyl/phenylalanyl-tRNA--protein transferase